MNKKDIQVLVKELKNFRENVLELLFPNTCMLCEKLSPLDMCQQCMELNPVSEEPRCMNCGKIIMDGDVELCLQCSVKQFYFDQGASLWHHGGQIKRAVYRFKYNNHRVYGKYFAKVMVKNYRNKIIDWKPDCVVAIPVHKSRLRTRGYNQAEVLAVAITEEIYRQIGIELPYIKGLISRNKSTTFQKLLDSNQRARNLAGVFQLDLTMKLPERVLVIDDIYTTGSTLNEVAKVLKKHGVKEVYFLTISIGQGF